MVGARVGHCHHERPVSPGVAEAALAREPALAHLLKAPLIAHERHDKRPGVGVSVGIHDCAGDVRFREIDVHGLGGCRRSGGHGDHGTRTGRGHLAGVRVVAHHDPDALRSPQLVGAVGVRDGEVLQIAFIISTRCRGRTVVALGTLGTLILLAERRGGFGIVATFVLILLAERRDGFGIVATFVVVVATFVVVAVATAAAGATHAGGIHCDDPGPFNGQIVRVGDGAGDRRDGKRQRAVERVRACRFGRISHVNRRAWSEGGAVGW